MIDRTKIILNNIILVLIIVICTACYIYFNTHLFLELKEAGTQKLTLNYPIYAIQDSDNNRYIIDNSRRRISKINPEGKIVYRLHGGSREEQRFFYANEIEVDEDGYLYVLNYIADSKGFYLDREEILRFSPEGHYDGVVYRKDFEIHDKKAQLIQRGEIFSLEAKGKTLSWFNLTGAGISRYNHTIDHPKPEATKYYHSWFNPLDKGNIESLRRERVEKTEKYRDYPLAEANIVVSDIVQLSADSFVYSSKDGLIQQVSADGRVHVIFSAEQVKAATGEFIVPWEIGADAAGKIYFIDLEGKNVRSIVSTTESRILLDQSVIESQQEIKIEPFNYYRLSVNSDGTLITCNDEAVVTQTPDKKVKYLTTADLPLTWQFNMMIFLICCATLLLLVPWKIYLIYVQLFNRKLPNTLVLSIGIVIIVAFVAALSSYYFITNFTSRYQQVVFEKLSQIIQLVPKVLDEERLERIKQQTDFNNDDYKYVYNTLYDSLNQNKDEWNQGYYFALYRVMNDRLYGFMYIDGQINMYYPFDWLGDGGVYDRALAGKIATEAATDITGDWIYGVGPVTNADGKVVALLEIGTDLYYLRLENERLIKELVLNLAVVLIIFVLVLVEISYITELHKKKHQKVAVEEDQTFSEVMLIRPLSFLYFTAISVSVTFIPLLMKQLYEPIAGFSQEMVLAMPLSLEMFCFGIGTTVAGTVASRTGWKSTFYLGLCATFTGLLLSGLADDMLLFNVARSIIGIGAGFSFIAMRSFINQERRTIERSQGFSQFYAGMTAGISVGAVFGGVLANHLNFSNIFFIAIGIIILALIFQLSYLNRPFSHSETQTQRHESLNLLSSLKIFLMSGRNFVFFIMIIFPTYIAGTFAGYYFPLFAESQGLSTASTGLFIISGGLLIIYLGPVLSHYLERQWGTYRSMVLGSVLWGVSLIVFALTGDLMGAMITLILMGVTEGFSVTAQNEFFLKLPLVNQLGEDRAVGYFEFFSSVAETMGPITFAVALIFGTGGFMVLGIGIITLTLLFVILTPTPRPNQGQLVASG